MNKRLPQSLVKSFHVISVVDGFDHMQEGGMGTSEALTELDQVAGEDVGTLYGDRDRDGTISVGEEIRRAVADAWKDGIGLDCVQRGGVMLGGVMLRSVILRAYVSLIERMHCVESIRKIESVCLVLRSSVLY